MNRLHLWAATLFVAALAFATPARAQSSPVHYLSAATTNCTLVKTGKVAMKALLPINTTTALYYLKLFDKATAPVAGTDIPKWTIPIPFGASNSGGGVALPSDGIMFATGFGFCLTGGIADNDNSNAATGIAINFGLTGQ